MVLPVVNIDYRILLRLYGMYSIYNSYGICTVFMACSVVQVVYSICGVIYRTCAVLMVQEGSGTFGVRGGVGCVQYLWPGVWGVWNVCSTCGVWGGVGHVLYSRMWDL